MSMTPEEDFENAKAICANLGLPEPKEMDSPARLLAEKILANLREPISGTIEEMERNELLEIESLIQAELGKAEMKEQIQHNFYLVAIEQRDEAYKKLAEAKREVYEEGKNEGLKLNQLVNKIDKNIADANELLDNEIRKEAYLDAAKIADEHNGCIERECLDRGLNCGVTIAAKLREKAGE